MDSYVLHLTLETDLATGVRGFVRPARRTTVYGPTPLDGLVDLIGALVPDGHVGEPIGHDEQHGATMRATSTPSVQLRVELLASDDLTGTWVHLVREQGSGSVDYGVVRLSELKYVLEALTHGNCVGDENGDPIP